MSNDEATDDNKSYRVIVSKNEQYSIWPADHATPTGWTEAGKTGTKHECLAYIEAVWTDMRPPSVREKMANKA